MTESQFIQLLKTKLQDVEVNGSNYYFIDSYYWTTTVA